MIRRVNDHIPQIGTHAASMLWYLLALPESYTFQQALNNVAHTQDVLLMRLLRCNAHTEWGQRYGFAQMHSIAAYQARVPLTTYGDYRAAIERIEYGQQGILTRAPVHLLEPTSGSTTATKYIPYTSSLKAEFQRALAPWVVDLFRSYPALMSGPSYWSVTPVTRHNRYTPGGIPIGFEEESAYFGLAQRMLIGALMAVPPLVRLIDDMAAFRYVTLLFLLRCRSLAFISVWNPTFLTLLVEPLQAWWQQLAIDIAHGSLSPPQPLNDDLYTRFVALNYPDPQRGTEIEAIFQAGGTAGTMHALLWPNLQLISCWTDAWAARAVPELQQLFPQAYIQGKGLLATEGCVSFPLVGQKGAALAVRSHFFEFLQAGAEYEEHPRLAHQLEIGGCYSVVLTTGGGLYRYQLHDLVEVVGYLKTCPLLRFVGKAAHISDRCGEKVHEQHVRHALDNLLTRHSLHAIFAMVACEEHTGCFAYTLFIESPTCPDDTLRAVGCELEQMLQENYHYRYCRDLGQLKALRVFRIDSHANATYLAQCQRYGQRAGDIKHVALHQRGGWTGVFRGRLIE